MPITSDSGIGDGDDDFDLDIDDFANRKLSRSAGVKVVKPRQFAGEVYDFGLDGTLREVVFLNQAVANTLLGLANHLGRECPKVTGQTASNFRVGQVAKEVAFVPTEFGDYRGTNQINRTRVKRVMDGISRRLKGSKGDVALKYTEEWLMENNTPYIEYINFQSERIVDIYMKKLLSNLG